MRLHWRPIYCSPSNDEPRRHLTATTHERVCSEPHHSFEMNASETYNQGRRRSACCRHQLTARRMATWKDHRTEAWQRWSSSNSQGDFCRQRDYTTNLPTVSTQTECLNVLSSLFNTCWNCFVWITCKFYVNLFICWNVFVWLNVTHLMGPMYTPLSPALCVLEMLFVD